MYYAPIKNAILYLLSLEGLSNYIPIYFFYKAKEHNMMKLLFIILILIPVFTIFGKNQIQLMNSLE